MSCAPFRVAVSKARLPEFPTPGICSALDEDPEHPECSCRLYPGRGFYVLGACGHAHGWDFGREDADAQCERLNDRAAQAAAAADEVGPTGSSAPSGPAVEEQVAATAESRGRPPADCAGMGAGRGAWIP